MLMLKKLRQWMKNARSLSLVQSLMPAILAVVLAIGAEGFNLALAILSCLGVACAHLGMNLADDYFDYKADMLSDRDRVIRKGFRAMMVKYPYLTDGSETLRSLGRAIAAFIAAALACGAVIFTVRSIQNGVFTQNGTWLILALTLCCAFLGVFYSAPPLKLAYRGFGELVIGFIFGPLLMMGVYYSTAGKIDMQLVMVSIPVGLLVLNILFTHSFIERKGDAESNKKTLALLLGSDKACMAVSLLINFLPYLMIALACLCGQLHYAYLAVFLVLPRSIWLCRSLYSFIRGDVDIIERPPRYMGNMMDWEGIKEASIGWFMGRWLASRNILSAFCAVISIVAIILLFV